MIRLIRYMEKTLFDIKGGYMLVKNKIVEQITDEQEKEAIYYDLDNYVCYGISYKDIPRKRNVIPCGNLFLVRNPSDEQFTYCEGGLLSLYDYLPYMKDDAEFYKNYTREEFAEKFKFMDLQYDPCEVYDFLMDGLKNNTLHNIVDHIALDTQKDEENDRQVSIFDVYEKGEWKHYLCVIVKGEHDSRLMTFSLKQDINRAMRYFRKRLETEEIGAFNKLKLGKEMEAE